MYFVAKVSNLFVFNEYFGHFYSFLFNFLMYHFNHELHEFYEFRLRQTLHL